MQETVKRGVDYPVLFSCNASINDVLSELITITERIKNLQEMMLAVKS